MAHSDQVLKRLYLCAGDARVPVDASLAADTLAHIGRLENALRGDLRPMGFERLLIIMGETVGALSTPHHHSALVNVLRTKALSRSYIASLRDQLTEILDESSGLGVSEGRQTSGGFE